MRAFDYHPLSKVTVQEKLLFGLTYAQSGWIGLGLYLSSELAGIIPPIPFIKEYAILCRLHYLTPLGVCCVFGFVKHSSGMSFPQYFISYIKYKKRRKIILDHNQN